MNGTSCFISYIEIEGYLAGDLLPAIPNYHGILDGSDFASDSPVLAEFRISKFVSFSDQVV